MQPPDSGHISIPESSKTWTWEMSTTLAPQITEKSKNVSKVGPRRLPKYTLKSIKKASGPQGVQWVCLWTPGSPKGSLRVPKWSLKDSKMTVFGKN